MPAVKCFLFFLMFLTINHDVSATGYNTTISAGITIREGSTQSSSKELYYTCRAAKNKILMAGFDQLRILNCNGNMYSFSVVSNGANMTVNFDSQTGDISVPGINN